MNKPTTENMEAMISFLADKKENKGCRFKFLKNWTTQNGYMTFEVGDIVDLGYMDSKYECIFFHEKVRGDLKIHRRFVRENMEAIGHPVMIGRVLHKAKETLKHDDCGQRICQLWYYLGFDKGLNEILGGEVAQADNAPVSGNEEYKTWVVFLDNNIQSLWELLVKLFPNYKQ